MKNETDKGQATQTLPSQSELSLYNCQFCDTPLEHKMVDLGMSPLCESYVSRENLNDMEAFYPVQAFVCENCFLVQVPPLVNGEAIYSHHASFSSYSDFWLRHSEKYSDMIVERFGFDTSSRVIEVASNDGYMLQYFIKKGFTVLGVDPAKNIADVAIKKGIPTIIKFFGEKTAQELVDSGKRADLLIGNHVLDHLPDINDFVKGLKILLSSDGVLTMEFSHLMKLIQGNQFDQICQEHYCYFSFLAVNRIFAKHGLTIFDVEELPTHGGSIRIYVRHTENQNRSVLPSVSKLLDREAAEGYGEIKIYQEFAKRVVETKRKILDFLIQAKREGKQIAGYGAPGKGSSLLNYCGVRQDFIDYTVDRNPFKQGKFLPGVHIPIFTPEKIAETKPDYVWILAWNVKDEIMQQLEYVREWGAQFVVPIPEPTIYS